MDQSPTVFPKIVVRPSPSRNVFDIQARHQLIGTSTADGKNAFVEGVKSGGKLPHNAGCAVEEMQRRITFRAGARRKHKPPQNSTTWIGTKNQESTAQNVLASARKRPRSTTEFPRRPSSCHDNPHPQILCGQPIPKVPASRHSVGVDEITSL